MTEPEKKYATPERAEAARLRKLYEATIAALRSDEALKPRVRDRQIRDMHAEGRQRLAKLREADRQRLGAEHKSAQKELFNALRKPWRGTAADTVAIRDAEDRAARLKDPAEAAALMRRARDNGDHSLEAAIGRVAAERNVDDSPGGKAWRGVLEQYVAAEPESRQPLVERLAQLENMVDPTAAPFGGALGDEFVLRQPREARGGGFGDTVGGEPTPSIQS